VQIKKRSLTHLVILLLRREGFVTSKT